MIETTCPTCGARCQGEEIHCPVPNCSVCNTWNSYKVFPQPDLTKLREAYTESLGQFKEYNRIGYCNAKILLQAVKELLEGK